MLYFFVRELVVQAERKVGPSTAPDLGNANVGIHVYEVETYCVAVRFFISCRKSREKRKKGEVMIYSTQMEAAKKGILTPEMRTVAKKENLSPDVIMERVAKGTIAIPANKNHTSLSAEGVGEGLRTKINVNLGVSGDCADYEEEFEKSKALIKIRRTSHYGSQQLRKNQHLSPTVD